MTEELPGTTILDGIVTLGREIGAGSGGTRVFLADHRTHGRCVFKMIPMPFLAREKDRVARYFDDEVKCGRSLVDPHIRSMFDAGEVSSLPGFGYPQGVYYLVLEYLSQTLNDVLDDGPLSPDDVRDLVNAMAAGLDAAHRASPRVVHRDLKPSNILLDGREFIAQAKIADFGIAREEGGDRITSSFHSAGTQRYMPPEQFANSSNVGVTSDVYALALVVWECLTGIVPNASSDIAETLIARRSGVIPQLMIAGRHYPHLEGALAKALSPSPSDRMSSATAFADLFTGSGAEDGLWSLPEPEDSLAHKGTVVPLVMTPPESVGEIGDLGRKKPYTGKYLQRRQSFGVLWEPTEVEVKRRGWAPHRGSIAELYLKNSPLSLVERVWFSPTAGVMRIRVTPRGTRERSILLDRLSSVNLPGGRILRFTLRDGNVEAAEPLELFFAGIVGSSAMAKHLRDTAIRILDSIG